MIILHSGMSKENGTIIVGYAVKREGEYYIVLESGSCIKVERETVMPYKTFHYIEDYASFSEQILNEFHSKGAYYLEDLARWSTKDFEHVRGVGKVRREFIQKIVHELLD